MRWGTEGVGMSLFSITIISVAVFFTVIIVIGQIAQNLDEEKYSEKKKGKDE
jgi:preprotein translocase subunit SecG